MTSLDNENHNHYTVDVIAPNHALLLPIYIGVIVPLPNSQIKVS